MIKKNYKITKIFIYVLIRAWKSYDNFDRCINSVLSQSYNHYKIIFVDDNSKLTKLQKVKIKTKLHKHIVVFNNKRKYSLKNAYDAIYKYALNKDAIIFNLDGDDWLPNNHSFEEVVKIYVSNPHIKLTYGECYIYDGKQISKYPSRFVREYTNTKYSNKTFINKDFRKKPFLPLHPRTWKVSLFKSIPKSEFVDSNGKWLRFAEDMAIFFPMLEKLKQSEIKVLKKPIYIYNQANPHSDVSENLVPLLKDELEIRLKHRTKKTLNQGKTVNLYYHRLLSVPIAGSLIYKYQKSLLTQNLYNNIFISNKNNSNKSDLINALQKSDIILIKSTKLLNTLKLLNAYKILDVTDINLKKMDHTSLYNLMWSLVFCDAVTKKTKKSIRNILPNNYPVVY